MGHRKRRAERVNAGSRRRDEQGSVLVEAVIIVPLVMLLTFGAIEFGLGFSQKGGLESVSRAGARKAATLAGVADNADGTAFGVETAQAVNAALKSTSLPAEMNALYVYKVDPDGTPHWTAKDGCGNDCTAFSFNTGTQEFDAPVGGWLQHDRHACGDTPDRVGVTVVGKFHFLTNLVGVNPIRLSPTSILQLEPTNCDA